MNRSERTVSPGELIERINAMGIEQQHCQHLYQCLGITFQGKVEKEGAWSQGTTTDLQAIIGSFLYCYQKNDWITAKHAAINILRQVVPLTADQADEVKVVDVYTDGASRGNPGHAGIGVAIYDQQGNLLWEVGKYIGKATNNIAEYQALLEGITIAREMNANSANFYLDSELVVKQLQGLYKVKNEGLQPLYKKVVQQLKQLERFSISHIRRERNKKADELANHGIDTYLDD